MISKFALFTNLLLASVALAAPSSQLGARLAHRRENRQSQPIQRIDSPVGDVSNIHYTVNWAGAGLNKSEGTFTTVTGTFTVPAPSGSNGGASIWVGIDGDACGEVILQTGIYFTITNGTVSYTAWYEWFPDYASDFTGITINAGDVIKTTVTASSRTSGTAIIENLTTHKTVTKHLTSSFALCQQNAEWIVEDFEEGIAQVPFGNFGTMAFSNAIASGPGGTVYTPSQAGATVFDIKQNDQVLTSVTTEGSTVTVKYV